MPWWRLAKPTRLPCIQESQPPRCIGSSPGTIAWDRQSSSTQKKADAIMNICPSSKNRPFCSPFFARAPQGEIATVEPIQQAFEAQVQHEVPINSIYRLLHRQGWRKLAPRSRHPKAHPQEQEAFQKNFSAGGSSGLGHTRTQR